MRRAMALLMGLILAVSAKAHAASSFGQYDAPPTYPERITTSLYLPMRDGVRLAVSITRPAKDGKPVEGRFPVIWHHTLAIAGPGSAGGPVGSGPNGYSSAFSLANYGYVIVQVARRGQGPSFGVRRGYNDRTESDDAYEVIDWLAEQAWSTGKVGIYGCSNTGDAAMHAVTAGNPHLKAAWAGCFSWEKYDGFLRGGILANWGTGPERTVEQDMLNTPVQGDEAKTLLHQAAVEHLPSTSLLELWKGLPYRDSTSSLVTSRFWIEGSAGRFKPQINRSGVAIYVQGGWLDDLRLQGLIAYANLTGPRHIVIGNWIHCANPDFDLLAEMRRFFDEELKGVDTGVQSEDPIHYFTVNAAPGTEWRSAKQWPPPGAASRTLYLAPSGPTGGMLTGALPAKPAAGEFKVSYDVGCPPGHEGPRLANLTPGLLTGALPCFPETAGPHFLGAPLKADTEVTGSPVADLWVRIDATDQNVFVYLEDVAPDGAIHPVTDGRLKASLRKTNAPPFANFGLPWHRAYQDDAQPLTPGEPARLQLDLLPTSYIFKAGHRIRITVAGADFREKFGNTGTGPLMAILSDKDHASSVSLPTMP